MTCHGPLPWCTVLDPSFFVSVGVGSREHCSHWEVVLGDTAVTTAACLALDYGALQRTLVFTLQRHESLLRAIWLERRLAICSMHGCPAVLVNDIPRNGLEQVLQHAVVLSARSAVSPN